MDTSVYRKFIGTLERTLEYWQTIARIGFVADLARIMEEDDISRSELARRAKTSQPYVSKALNGDTNFTIKTMIKLARAVGCTLQIRLTRPGEVLRVVNVREEGSRERAISLDEVVEEEKAPVSR